MVQSKFGMKPQDIVVLLRIVVQNSDDWQQLPLSRSLKMSQSEVSQSVARSKYAGLLDNSGKKVMRRTLMDFLCYGLAVVFPAKPGAVVRGVLTAHSAAPLNKIIKSSDIYVWPFGNGEARGQAVAPLYRSVPEAVLVDERLHALLALTDALRVGRTREKNIAMDELKGRIVT